MGSAFLTTKNSPTGMVLDVCRDIPPDLAPGAARWWPVRDIGLTTLPAGDKRNTG